MGDTSSIESITHVIIVGLGIVGLAAAIECREKGLTVTAFDKSDILEPIGDCIGIPSNAARIIRRWGNGSVHEAIRPWVVTSRYINIHNSSGQRILQQDLSEVCKDTNYLIPRSELVRVMYDHARSIGVRIELGATASNPVEHDDGSDVVITTKHSKKVFHADCVIMSDGVHSKMRRAIMGEITCARPTGYAAFRALADVKTVAEDPEARWVLEDSEHNDRFDVFFLDRVQIAVQTCNGGKIVTWFCIHEDNSPSQDVWTSPANPEDVHELLKGPTGQRLWAFIRHTPQHKFINYPLINHKPLDHWVSKRNRLILIGDAAHPLSPAAGQGAAQGIEDANVLAVCLALAGKCEAPLALQVTERIRYSRASAIQVTSHRANEGWRNQNWDLFDPQQETVASLPLEEWIFNHDSQAYTLAEFHHIATTIREGKTYIPHNVPDSLRVEVEVQNFES